MAKVSVFFVYLFSIATLLGALKNYEHEDGRENENKNEDENENNVKLRKKMRLKIRLRIKMKDEDGGSVTQWSDLGI